MYYWWLYAWIYTFFAISLVPKYKRDLFCTTSVYTVIFHQQTVAAVDFVLNLHERLSSSLLRLALRRRDPSRKKQYLPTLARCSLKTIWIVLLLLYFRFFLKNNLLRVQYFAFFVSVNYFNSVVCVYWFWTISPVRCTTIAWLLWFSVSQVFLFDFYASYNVRIRCLKTQKKNKRWYRLKLLFFHLKSFCALDNYCYGYCCTFII